MVVPPSWSGYTDTKFCETAGGGSEPLFTSARCYTRAALSLSLWDRESDLAVSPRGVEGSAGQETAREDAAFAHWGAIDHGGDRVGRIARRHVDAARAAHAHGQQPVAAADDPRAALVAGITPRARGPRPAWLRRLRRRFGLDVDLAASRCVRSGEEICVR